VRLQSLPTRLTLGSSLKQQLDDTAGETHTLRLTLEDAQTALTTASSFADSLQNQYEEVSADKLRLEDELARQQETIANRSTESESRQRDEQLFRYKEDREVLQWTLEVDRQQHEKDIAAVTFGKAQDIRAARARMSELESRVSELQAVLRDAQKSRGEGGNEHVGQLELKVQLLRAERDDSRRSQSFGEHEHHFALKTAEADRASAVEDLAHARCELQEHLTAHDNLQKETGKLRERLQDVSARLESVAGSFATASTEKNDLADRVAHLELEVGHATTVRDELERKVVEATQQEATSLEAHRTHHEQLVDLASRLVMEQSERSKAQNELVMSNRARSDLESRVDQLHVRIIELQEAQPLREDDSPSNGHVRSRSSTSSSTALQSLQAEKADLQSRLQRRIRKISTKTSV